MVSSPILRLPDLSCMFTLRTDASNLGIGAVLLQENKEVKFPVAYASKKLLPRETKYSVIERECLVLVWEPSLHYPIQTHSIPSQPDSLPHLNPTHLPYHAFHILSYPPNPHPSYPYMPTPPQRLTSVIARRTSH